MPDPAAYSVIETLRNGREIEIRAQHADGTWKTLRIIANPLFDENGIIIGMVSSGRDLTESNERRVPISALLGR